MVTAVIMVWPSGELGNIHTHNVHTWGSFFLPSLSDFFSPATPFYLAGSARPVKKESTIITSQARARASPPLRLPKFL